MHSQDRTIILLDEALGIPSEQWVQTWNANTLQEDLPEAYVLTRGKTFDPGLPNIVGDVANVIQIISFVGVPTIATIVTQVLKKRAAAACARGESQATTNFQIEETIIDLGDDGRVRRVVIRRSSTS